MEFSSNEYFHKLYEVDEAVPALVGDSFIALVDENTHPSLVRLATDFVVQLTGTAGDYSDITLGEIEDVLDALDRVLAVCQTNPQHAYRALEQALSFGKSSLQKFESDSTWVSAFLDSTQKVIKAGFAEDLAQILSGDKIQRLLRDGRCQPDLTDIFLNAIEVPDEIGQLKNDVAMTLRQLSPEHALDILDVFALKNLVEKAQVDSAVAKQLDETTSKIGEMVFSWNTKNGSMRSDVALRLKLAFVSMASYQDEEAYALSDAADVVKRAVRRVEPKGLFRNFLYLAAKDITLVREFGQASRSATRLFEEVIYQATLEHSMSGGRPSEITEKFINTESRSDEPPSRSSDERAQMFQEGIELRYKLSKFILGFGGSQYSARSMPVNNYYSGLPLLARAAIELDGTGVYRANASSNSIFPGMGLRFTGLNSYKFLSKSDLEAPEFFQSGFANSINREFGSLVKEFADATFTFLRGLIIVESPSIRFSTRVDSRAYDIPLTLIIYNEHFRKGSRDGALLVPSSVINEIGLDKYFQNWEDYAGYRPSHFDLCELEDRLGYQSLQDRAQKYIKKHKIPVIDLMSISTIGGSLAKSVPPKSEPFMTWQQDLYAGTPDIGGHIHYYYAYSTYGGYTESSISLRDLREVHRAVFQAGSTAIKLLELFEIGYSHFCQGIEGVLEGDVDGESTRPDIPDSYESWVDQRNQRMLAEAILWNSQPIVSGHRSLTDSDYPVLCMTPTFQPGSPIDDTFYLDTKTMMLHTAYGSDIDLSGAVDDIDQRIVDIWQHEVVGKYFGQNLTPRFMNRVVLTDARS